jgi:hypothetical protein
MADRLINNSNMDRGNIYALTINPPKNVISGINYRKSADLFVVATEISNKNPDLFIMLISGHGYTVPDTSGDEPTGQDQEIITDRPIIDDLIYQNIVCKMNNRLLLFSDTCHSGTMFDLPYVYDDSANMWRKNSKRDGRLQNTAISISACDDTQLSMCDIGEKTGFGGSLTTALLNCDSAFEDLIEYKNIKACYTKIKERLKLLNQRAILSSSDDKLLIN